VTAPTVPLSPECAMARDEYTAEVHGWCRKAEDVPLPDARPYEPLIAKASCHCPCHSGAPRG
jgi:hypothetical protein